MIHIHYTETKMHPRKLIKCEDRKCNPKAPQYEETPGERDVGLYLTCPVRIQTGRRQTHPGTVITFLVFGMVIMSTYIKIRV